MSRRVRLATDISQLGSVIFDIYEHSFTVEKGDLEDGSAVRHSFMDDDLL